jgi:hypothetical protein
MSDLSPKCAPTQTLADHFEFVGTCPKPSLSSDFEFGTASLSVCGFAQSILVALLLNLREVPVTHTSGLGGPEVP